MTPTLTAATERLSTSSGEPLSLRRPASQCTASCRATYAPVIADGGTRTAAITGAYVALHDAVHWLAGRRKLSGSPDDVLKRSVSAVSVGIIGGEPRLDLCYEEDVVADVDMNIVCTGAGDFVEVQGTGEQGVFSRDQLTALLDLGVAGCLELTELQRKAVA